MKVKSRKPLSVILALAMVFGLITAMPMTASAIPPDLNFTLAPSSSTVSMTQITSVSNGEGGTNVFVPSYGMSIPWTGTIGADRSSSLPGTTIPYEWPSRVAIGKYLTLEELTSTGTLVNYGNVQITNSMLLAPTPGATTIAGGAGKVTVSSYAAVTNCKLYLVPSSLYPVGGGTINLGNASVKEITTNGDITGLSAGN